MLEEGKNDAPEQGENRKSLFVIRLHTANNQETRNHSREA
jgi:hypothetical protein